MTLNLEVPYITYEGDGSKTLFTFDFSLTEEPDFYLSIDGEGQTRYSDYDLQNVTDTGGEIVMFTAPADGALVQLYRRTNITQQVDYLQYEAFPAETHEANLDKIVRILQELRQGLLIWIDGEGNEQTLSFDLDAVPDEDSVLITNTGGTDADIPQWVSGGNAGVFVGEYLPEANIPADGSASTLPDGTILLGY